MQESEKLKGSEIQGAVDNNPPQSDRPFDAAKILKEVSPSVAKIKTIPDKNGEWSVGTGFFVSSGERSSCEIATVSHTTAGAKSIEVITNTGKTFEAESVAAAPKFELQIYKLKNVENPEQTCKPLELSPRKLSEGELVLGVSAAADPRWPEPYIGQSIGLVTRDNPVWVRRLPTLIGEDMLRTMGAFIMRGEHGDSGGPILDRFGKVVGLEAATSNGYSLSELASHLQDTLNELKHERKIRP